MSFKCLLDQRLLCFISYLKRKCSSLIPNLILWNISNCEIRKVIYAWLVEFSGCASG